MLKWTTKEHPVNLDCVQVVQQGPCVAVVNMIMALSVPQEEKFLDKLCSHWVLGKNYTYFMEIIQPVVSRNSCE